MLAKKSILRRPFEKSLFLFSGSASKEMFLPRNRIISVVIFLAIVLFTGEVFAQTGSIRGEVREVETGEALIGANVIVQGTDKGASTDIDGRYVIRSVPEGEYTLIFRYLGFESKEEIVTVVAGESIEVNMELSSTYIEGEEIQVTAHQRGQSRALSEQRKSVNIKNVISSEQIEAFADNTVTGALSRIAGMGHGGTNIRGVGAGSANVTMDGQRMGATGSNRSVDLSTISADMVQDLEVIKVITPDMDADALAGVININTRRPVGGERNMNIRLGGGVQDRYIKHTGTITRASISYGDSPTDKYSFGLNLSYQRDPSASEDFRTEWEGQAFDGFGTQDILSNVASNLNYTIPERIGTGAQFTFQPNDWSTYHVQGMFNIQNRSRYQYGVSYNPRMANYISNPTYTGDPDGGGGANDDNQGTIRYNPRLDESVTHQYTVQAGGRHRLENVDLQYKLGWGHGRYNDDQYRMNFQTDSNYEFIFDTEDRWNPTVDIAPWSRSISPTFPTPDLMLFEDMDHRINSSVDNDVKASIDLDIPIRWGTFKTGASTSLTSKRGVGERLLKVHPSLDVADFKQIENGSWELFDRTDQTYQIPWLIDLNNARKYYITQAPRFRLDQEGRKEWALSTETSRYFANENTFAAYAMGNFKFDWFSILGGVRVEHTYNTYSGREGNVDGSGRFTGATDIESTNSYTNFFPNLQTVFGLGSMTNIRLAYSRSIGRPSFNQLNPYIMRNAANQTIQQGNPRLSPMLSNNFDLLFEHYFMNVGQFTIGLFYKDMKDFVFSYSERIQADATDEDAEYAGWTRSGYRNGEQATVYGAEFMWQQNLEFLPGILGNLGTYVNYSYAQSIADLDRSNEQSTHGLASLFELVGLDSQFEDFEDYKYITPLAGQRPHVVNGGLDFSKGEFFAQVSYQWAAPSISSYGSNDQDLIASPTPRAVYFDLYNAAAQNLSFTARYWISPYFQIWIDASNILNHQEVNYYYDKDYYPYSTILRGREITVGLRYKL